MANESGIFVIRWTEACNNRCVMCSLHGGDSDSENASLQDIFSELKSGRSRHDRVELSGGEPTVREGFIEAVTEAKILGYEEIGISTNGRKLADKDFCDRAVAAGLNRITFAIHGATPETHDAVTQVKGSFDEIVAGMKNAKDSGIRFGAASVLSSINASEFEKIGELLFFFGADNWNISDLIPDGRAHEAYSKIAVSPEDITRVIAESLPVMARFESAGIFNFSRCFFPKDLPQRMFFIDMKRKMQDWDMDRKDGRYAEEKGIYKDMHKSLLVACDNCPYKTSCGGYWNEAIALFGEGKINSVIENIRQF